MSLRASAGGSTFGGTSGWGRTPILTWLLARGDQVTGQFKSSRRVRKLVHGITDWQPTSSPGREVALVPDPVPFARPLAPYAVRTPSKEYASGYYQAVLFTTRTAWGCWPSWTTMTAERALRPM